VERDSILIVDDDECSRLGMSAVLLKDNHDVDMVDSGAQALARLERHDYALAIVDLLMPGLSGIETIQRIKQISPETEIIVFSGHPSVENTLKALHQHVFDFLDKPVEPETARRVVRHALEHRRLTLKNRELVRLLEMKCDRLAQEVQVVRRALESQLAASPLLVGESEAINDVRRQVAEVAPSDMTVLVQGESGTGKDVVARLIHDCSGRNHAGQLIRVNCPSIPEALLESELFGHEAGAYTGALRRKPGRFELAAGGTIFLDEICSVSTGFQAKLLQAIEHKQFTRVGGTKTITVDVRIIAATNSSLDALLAENILRKDLFFRLQQFTIVIPPLRERRDDIPLLVRHFLRRFQIKFQRDGLVIPDRCMARMMDHDWPGNVRELETVIQRFALTGNVYCIEQSLDAGAGSCVSGSASPRADGERPLREQLENAEAERIRKALVETHWNQLQAAKILGVSYSTLRRRIAKYNLA